jgi:hypothetical protein
VALFVFKLGLTPALIGLATIVSRRWGPAIGGLLVALPLTSGPVLFFLAIDHGDAFAAQATGGSLAGATAVTAFCLAYAWMGRRFAWWAAFVAACVGFAAMSVAMQPVITGPAVVLVALAFIVPFVGLRLLPAHIPMPDETLAPWWDIPARMALGAALVVGITAGSAVLGPELSGLLRRFPSSSPCWRSSRIGARDRVGRCC